MSPEYLTLPDLAVARKGFVLALITLVTGAGWPALGDEIVRPNVLVILSDDQGWGDIGYNNPKVYTPNLDKLAREGAILAQHYVMPQCTPTRVALFTGRYPGRFGISGLQASNRPILPHGTLTMASFLKAQGYETYLTGKWHMGSWLEHGPNHHGFDYSYGALAGAVGAYVHLYRAPQLVHPNAITWHRNHEIIPGYENGTHVTDLVTAEAIKVIKKKRQAPFFLYLPYFAPHTPLDERGRFVKVPTHLDGDNPGRWLNEGRIEWFNDPAGKIQQEKDPEKRLFLAVVHHLDSAIGKVVAALEETGQRRNTIIFFSSDNGPQVNWGGGSYPSDLRLTDFNQPIPFRGAKTDVWEGGIRVPGFVNWPGKISPKTIDSPQHIIDWLPTIAGIIGTTPTIPDDQPGFDGEDFSPLLLTDLKRVPREREVYSIHAVKTDKWALRLGDWKLVKYGEAEPTDSSWELYNLVTDPGETADVAADHPGIVKRLHHQFLTHRAQDKKEHNFPSWKEPN
jgi:arylsulfatase A-like enzyme